MPLFHYYIAVFRGRRQAARGIASPWTALPPMPYEVDGVPDEGGALVGFAESGIRACSLCGRLRPLRTHHCGSCCVCYVRFDHHCVWVAGCVAAHNYAHFWLFLFWAVVGCAYACIAVLANSIAVWAHGMSALSSAAQLTYTLCGLLGVFALVMGVATATLLFFHVKLLRSNQTTVEFYANKDKETRLRAAGIEPRDINPFDLGVHENVAEVFGAHFVAKLLLPIRVRPPRDPFLWERQRARIVQQAVGGTPTPTPLPPTGALVA